MTPGPGEIIEPASRSFEEAVLFSRSFIPLYPSLSCSEKRTGLAWYEYGSDSGPAPSRIYYADAAAGQFSFSEPLPLTERGHYDNGPYLLETNNGAWITWHSWRPPGRGPFTPDSRRYLWLAKREGNQWQEPFLPFGTEQESSYGAVAQSAGSLWMTATLGLNEIVMAHARNPAKGFRTKFLAGGQHSDLYQNGDELLAAYDSGHSIYAAKLSRDGFIEEPVCVPHARGSRPRISRCNGYYVLVWHSDHWGPQVLTGTLHHRGGHASLRLSPGKDAGNRHWAVSRLDLLDTTGKNRGGSFSDSAKFGQWNAPVEKACRVMGDAILSSSQPRSFSLDLPADTYQVRLKAESWVSPGIRLEAAFGQVPLSVPPQERDRIYLSASTDLRHWSDPLALTPGDKDRNRPTRVISLEGRPTLIYNRFGTDSVDLCATTFQIEDLFQ